MKQKLKHKLARIIPDKIYIKIIFYRNTGDRLSFKNPQTFNEKLQWLKVYNKNPLYTKLVDKYEVKNYIKEKIGEEYVIPTIGVWEHVDDINFSELPDQFVLKCTHDSGSIVICEDRNSFDYIKAKQNLNAALNINYFWAGREWPYKKVKRRIIAEPYLYDKSEKELKDYKFFCFQGIVKIIQVDFDRFVDHKRNIYNRDWEYLPFMIQYPTAPEHIIEKPKCLKEMIEIAEKLSLSIPHVRVDFYLVNDRPIVGEMTFFHGGGMEKIVPADWNKKMGEWIKLPDKKKLIRDNRCMEVI